MSSTEPCTAEFYSKGRVPQRRDEIIKMSTSETVVHYIRLVLGFVRAERVGHEA